MIKVFTIVGARPNFIKVDRELPGQVLVHTGQHYSYGMNQTFFKERKLPKPKWNLGCKGEEVGKMIDKLKALFKKEKPSLVLVFGDTNSSLAGALAAAYCNIKIAHVEAGLRSYRTDMPEEINRKIIDHLSTVLFCPNARSQMALFKEGIKDNVHIVGDPSFDAMADFLPVKRKKNYKKYHLLTLHRNFNADNKEFLKDVFGAIEDSEERVIFPIHPRTKKNIKQFGLKIPKNIKTISPRTYSEMLSLLSNCNKVLTDSGGVQREAYWMQKPVIILREDTEWTEILVNGAGMLANNKEEILRGIKEFNAKIVPPPVFGANKKIRDIIYKYV